MSTLTQLPGKERIAPRVTDPFGQRAGKLGALLGVSAERRALLIGDPGAEWLSDFAEHFQECVHVPSAGELEHPPGTPGYGIVVWAATQEEATAPDTRALACLRDALGYSGSLLLLCRNRFALRRLARAPREVLSPVALTGRGYRARLRRAGFQRVEEFVPLPRLSSTEEYVSRERGQITLPGHASRVEHALSTLGAFPFFHDGFAYIASGPAGGALGLLQQLGVHLSGIVRITGELVLERFDLRMRGSLVLLVRDAGSRRRFVCRLTTSDEVDAVVVRNAEWAGRVVADPRIPGDVRASVPRPYGSFRVAGGVAHVEQLLEGVIAWKLVRSDRLRPTLFAGVYGFVRELCRATAEPRCIDPGRFAGLADGPAVPGSDAELSLLVGRMCNLLREGSLGATEVFVWSHGDYGYGNALVDPATGVLRGVVDWDQAREDLAGVDLLTFLVQKRRIEAGDPLPEALREVCSRYVEQGFGPLGAGIDFDDLFPRDRASRARLVGWVTLRMVQRAACYPRVLAAERGELVEILGWTCGLLESAR